MVKYWLKLKHVVIWRENLSATVIANYDGYEKELAACGIDFGKVAILFTYERKGTRVRGDNG